MRLIGTARLIDTIDGRFGGEKKLRRIGVAVSGGSDSLALLHLIHDWGGAEALKAATVDHGLRPEAAEEAAQVATGCTALDIPHETIRWQGWDGKGNLQDHARRNRYELLARWAKRHGLDTVCLGHTLDDQVETFLMRLKRSAGVDGLAGMEQVLFRYDMRFDRPLLGQRRATLRGYLEEKGVAWIDDPSNDDRQYDRVKARQALAALEEMGLKAEDIEHSMVNLRMASFSLKEHARDVAQKIVKEVAGDVVFDRAKLRRQNPELQHRLLSGALMFVSSEDYPPRWEAMAEAHSAIFQTRNMTLHGCLILSSDMTVRITREFKAVERKRSATDAPWDGRWRLDGPHVSDLEIRALGEAIAECPEWRDAGLPRQSLLASPAIWRGETLVAAPVAGLSNGWEAKATGRGTFAGFLLSR